MKSLVVGGSLLALIALIAYVMVAQPASTDLTAKYRDWARQGPNEYPSQGDELLVVRTNDVQSYQLYFNGKVSYAWSMCSIVGSFAESRGEAVSEIEVKVYDRAGTLRNTKKVGNPGCDVYATGG